VRKSCLECVLKHLGQAAVLMAEVELGYPLHRILVVGHMAEASEESIATWPELAHAIRDERRLYTAGQMIDIMALIEKVEEVEDESES